MKTLASIVIIYLLSCGVYKNYEMVKNGTMKCFLIDHNFLNTTTAESLKCKMR